MELEDHIEDRKAGPSFSPRRQWSIGLHVVVSSLALFALAAMFNYLAHRYNQRI
jgi:hypothetical protein